MTLALLLRLGLRYAPVVPVAIFIAELLVRHVLAPWLPVLPTMTAVLINAGGYVGAAWLLRNPLKIDCDLGRQDDVMRLLAVSLVAAFLVACGTAANFVAFHMIAPGDFWTAVLRSWLGDYVGIVTLTPVILVFSGKDNLARLATLEWPFYVEITIQIAAFIAAIWFIFGLEWRDELKLFYLLFLPAMWSTVRHGIGGAAACILLTELSLKVVFQIRGFGVATVIDFQMLMVALGLTGLLVGAIVSERRQANQAWKESTTRLKAILHTAPDAILTLDDQNRIESVNPAVEQMFGWPAAALTQMPAATLLPDLTPDTTRPIHEHLAQRRDGTRFPVEIAIGQPTTGDQHYTIAVIRDISRRVEAESLVRQHQVELAHVDRVSIVGEMASAILHEESQPLAAIAAYTRSCRMLIESPDVDIKRVSQALDKLAAQTRRAGDILSRMRDFLHRGEIEMEPTGVLDIVGEVAEFAKTDLSEHDARLKFDVEPGVPDVLADRVHIQQVLLNLIHNAVEALSDAESDDRDIWLSARGKGRRVVFEVRDSGPGIAPDIADRLFVPFTSSKDRGMGLGLSISRTIVEAHNGKLRHIKHDGSGTGTTFTFDLPAAGFPC